MPESPPRGDRIYPGALVVPDIPEADVPIARSKHESNKKLLHLSFRLWCDHPILTRVFIDDVRLKEKGKLWNLIFATKSFTDL